MSLLLLFADQEQQAVQPDLPARRRRTTVILRGRKRPRIVGPLEEWEREEPAAELNHAHEHERLSADFATLAGAPTQLELSPDDLARAVAEDEEWLLLL